MSHRRRWPEPTTVLIFMAFVLVALWMGYVIVRVGAGLHNEPPVQGHDPAAKFTTTTTGAR